MSRFRLLTLADDPDLAGAVSSGAAPDVDPAFDVASGELSLPGVGDR